MIEQKLFRIKNDTYENDVKLREHVQEGWKIKNISACAIIMIHIVMCY